MSYQLDFKLSPDLEPYREKIEASIKPYLEIKLSDNIHPTWWQSKFGGFPYLPKNYEYPKSWDGEYLYLLAQINFAEIPPLDDFPEQGILQFYIGDHNGLYGADFDRPTQQNNFRIIYFSDIDLPENNLITDFSFLDKNPNLPIKGCSGLEFIKKYAPMCIADYFYYGLSKDEMEMAEEISIFLDEKEKEEELFADDGHKLGGYPFFTQDDPRPCMDFTDPRKDNYTLLLQMDSDSNETIDILWGDLGIGNFFIKRSALKKLDFSDVIYNWDCA